jgi:hypothetical protein
MSYRSEEMQRMAVIVGEVARRLEVIRKDLAVYQEHEQDLEHRISDLQALHGISGPEDGDPEFLKKLKGGIQDTRRELESALDKAIEQLSEHQRLEPDIVPKYRKEVGLLMENLPVMDDHNPLVIRDLEPGHSTAKYIVIRRLGKTKVHRGSGKPTQIVKNSKGQYIPNWKQWEERSLSHFFESDINSGRTIETALNALLEFYTENTKGVKVKAGK